MEFQVREFKTPEQILFNYEDLKQQLTEECHAYTKLVVTEDAIAPAKRDLADLRRLDKALNDERLRIQREYMKPFDSFKDRVDELRGIIKNAEANIDRQLKAFDEAQASKKQEEIQELFKSIGFQPFVRLEQIWNPKWMNKTYQMKQIEQDMKDAMYKVGEDIATISRLKDFSFEARQDYEKTLDINHAIAEGQRLAQIQAAKEKAIAEQKAREEAQKAAREQAEKAAEEARKAAEQSKAESTAPEETRQALDPEQTAQKTEAPEEQTRMWVGFEAYMTTAEAGKLAQFFRDNGIRIRRPQGGRA